MMMMMVVVVVVAVKVRRGTRLLLVATRFVHEEDELEAADAGRESFGVVVRVRVAQRQANRSQLNESNIKT